MVSLFASTTAKKRPRPSQTEEGKTNGKAEARDEAETSAAAAASASASASAAAAAGGGVEEVAVGESEGFLSEASWGELGLAPWVLKACRAMGFKRPTPVQAKCIPAVLAGRDVLGCAETGSGKTAAFALPMLHRLSEDPYGIFGVVLTPTRELAIQIAEQFAALGAPLGLRHAVVIGGVAMVDQAVELAKRPHVVIATPGRLWDHLRGPSPPDLSKARYLVLDEADRLFCEGFEAHLATILKAMTAPRRQTLLFSATMTTSLEELKALTKVQPVLFDLTRARALPHSLLQQYLFMPAQVKTCYLVDLLQKLLLLLRSGGGEGAGTGARAGSAIVFVGTCQRSVRLDETVGRRLS
jgi:superfamily II DNA/RNA helicase